MLVAVANFSEDEKLKAGLEIVNIVHLFGGLGLREVFVKFDALVAGQAILKVVFVVLSVRPQASSPP